MSAAFNTAEKQLLQYWLADGAPGYNTGWGSQLLASDLAAVGALDNDVVRGYLTSYQTQKLANLANNLTQANTRLSGVQTRIADFTTTQTTISGITVQTVPTT